MAGCMGAGWVHGRWPGAWALAGCMGDFFFIFIFLFLFFYKKFMPISARGTTVAQANSECTLITIRMYLSVI